ncbi:methylated-DNA--[protein]-cysteine S-methyltransferase [Paracoccus sp. DK608]|uniref:methylated-DNA--[protein]-cysteine S-methyltransferase n=2 Tax=Paracoccus shanxieyensis TaxID=2675752 RepID=A0A6L6IVP3_9RHOB|nr:methylated-DNA--[protein]-cysteine S-methyltransferase [Paracoccus shanxieyensis]MTH87709.1 methylated-DNA--[protein]-cysteine S-methyltransferase [Paracoccus shanxieyensis]
MEFTDRRPSRLRIAVTSDPKDGAGDLAHGTFASPIGGLVALGTADALWGLGIVGRFSAPQVLGDLSARWPHARLTEAPDRLAPMIDALLQDAGQITLRLTGTAFQMQVWHGLLQIPAGQIFSYAGLAQRIGRPTALRAVGTAVGQNPISWIVPCHRVTRADGSIGNYHWGEAAKRALLAREGAVLAPQSIAAM